MEILTTNNSIIYDEKIMLGLIHYNFYKRNWQKSERVREMKRFF